MLMHMNLSLSRKRKMRIIEGARLAMALPAIMYYVNLQLIFFKNATGFWIAGQEYSADVNVMR